MRLLVATALLSFLFPTAALAAGRVAVQPFGGPETEPYRQQVAKIVSRHGYKVITSLRSVTGTSQYPGLAKERLLNAFVVAHADDKGDRIMLSFLIWQGLDGGVIGRWEVTASKKQMPDRIAREFWRRLGRAIARARAPRNEAPRPPRGPVMRPAPTMYLDAGPDSTDTVPRRKSVRRTTPRKTKRPLAATI